ncbi:hypothetical protein AERO9AM_20266 [Aeromicrobium sp. 9AM]|nr:hypothetical protein AERO9AM_20266 [Aeromicrobium sp. 9AM]
MLGASGTVPICCGKGLGTGRDRRKVVLAVFGALEVPPVRLPDSPHETRIVTSRHGFDQRPRGARNWWVFAPLG